MSPAFFPPSQTTAWAIFSQDTRAAVLVLWPHPGPMWPGLTVGMGEGLAWQSWALVGGRDSSSRPPPPPLFMCKNFTLGQKTQAGEELKLGGGGEEGWSEWENEREREHSWNRRGVSSCAVISVHDGAAADVLLTTYYLKMWNHEITA